MIQQQETFFFLIKLVSFIYNLQQERESISQFQIVHQMMIQQRRSLVDISFQESSSLIVFSFLFSSLFEPTKNTKQYAFQWYKGVIDRFRGYQRVFHNRTDRPYICYDGSQGGFGNKIRSFLSAMTLSIVTNRTLVGILF